MTLLVVLPLVCFNLQFPLGLTSPPMRGFLIDSVHQAFNEIKRPLIFALIGWGLGSFVSAILERPLATAERPAAQPNPRGPGTGEAET